MNAVHLIGRLTQDPELRFTEGGTATTTIRLAVARAERNGEEQSPVYIDVVIDGQQAQAMAEHARKGRQIAVSGRLDHRECVDAEGGRLSKHEVVAALVELIGAATRTDRNPGFLSASTPETGDEADAFWP